MTATFNPAVLFHQVAGVFLLTPLCFIWLALLGLWLKRRALVLGALLICYLLATPWAALWLSAPLQPPALAVNLSAAHADAIVVLGGGKLWAPEYGSEQLNAASLMRLRYAATLVRQSGLPLLLCGGAPRGGTPEAAVMAQTLLTDYGQRARWLDTRSNTTAENAREAARLLLPAGMRRIVLVSSAWHLRRAAADFSRQGFTVTQAPTGFVSYDGPWWTDFLPAGSAMQQTNTALREWLALAVYRLGRLLGHAV
jgi:uncharacterized SAM-binding protein YcdF (DUF218 family)